MSVHALPVPVDAAVARRAPLAPAPQPVPQPSPSPDGPVPHAAAPAVGERVLRRAGRAVIGTLGPRLWSLQVDGAGGVPAVGPAILAANHRSFFDSVALVMAVPRPLTFVGKVEYLHRWRTRAVLPALGMIPVDRRCARRAWGALEVAAQVIDDGGLFAIYPEGTRSRDGLLHRGHRGVGHLAVATGAPVVPVGIVGTERVQPPGAAAPRPFRPVVVRFGEPIDPARYAGPPRERRRRLTDDVMAAIAELSGQVRADGATTAPSGR